MLLVEEKTEVLLQKLQSGEIDAAFVALPIFNESFASLKIFEEPFLLAVPRGHAFAKSKKIQAKKLRGQKLMLLEDGHWLRNQALEVCSTIGAFEQQDFKASSLETLRQMVAVGAGITLMPKIAAQKNDKIVYAEITNAHKRTIGLVWRKSLTRVELVKESGAIAKE